MQEPFTASVGNTPFPAFPQVGAPGPGHDPGGPGFATNEVVA
ncbi:hypothetical protein NONO_c75470 [Nocardia nova SH22a]|uniref:Uncharacterized protein n=1 Tax=Nocardia nova SH22a TaxID=1415166 RepID=W5TSL1_9NOCA|nr:hypothetical protein NONO_c75470 [Nocardia nova SH22a]